MIAFPSRRQTVAAFIVGAVVGCAHAEEKDPERIKLKVGETRNEDSNYLRKPEGKAGADTITTQTVDVNVAVPFGQQRVELEANLINNQHQTLTQFDFVGQNYSAAWRWSLSPTVLGVLSTKHTESLNSAADSIDPNLRNKNVTNLDNLTVGYLLGGPWRLLADYSKADSSNEHALLGVADVRYESYTVGFSYSPTSSDNLSYARRVDNGTSTSPGASASGYSYSGHALVASYAVTVNTSVKARLGYLEQRFTVDPKFDFSGVIADVEGTWHITGKTSLVVGWQRDLSSFQTKDSTYAQTETFRIAPNWQVRPTLSVGLQFKQGIRDALGNPGGSVFSRHDRTYDSTLNLQWQPRSFVSLRASLTQATRTSNVDDQDYTARILLLGAQLIF